MKATMTNLKGLRDMLYNLYNKEFSEGLSDEEISNYFHKGIDSKILKELIKNKFILKIDFPMGKKGVRQKYLLGPVGIDLIEAWEIKKLNKFIVKIAATSLIFSILSFTFSAYFFTNSLFVLVVFLYYL